MLIREGCEVYMGDQVSAVKTTAAQTFVCEGTIIAFRYSGLQVLIKIKSGEEHWCVTSSIEIQTA